MPTDPRADLAHRLQVIGHPSRLLILEALRTGPTHVKALTEVVGDSQPVTTHHLRLLRLAGFVERDRQGKCNFYSLVPGAVRATLKETRELLAGTGR